MVPSGGHCCIDEVITCHSEANRCLSISRVVAAAAPCSASGVSSISWPVLSWWWGWACEIWWPDPNQGPKWTWWRLPGTKEARGRCRHYGKTNSAFANNIIEVIWVEKNDIILLMLVLRNHTLRDNLHTWCDNSYILCDDSYLLCDNSYILCENSYILCDNFHN